MWQIILFVIAVSAAAFTMETLAEGRGFRQNLGALMDQPAFAKLIVGSLTIAAVWWLHSILVSAGNALSR